MRTSRLPEYLSEAALVATSANRYLREQIERYAQERQAEVDAAVDLVEDITHADLSVDIDGQYATWVVEELEGLHGPDFGSEDGGAA